jgi:hypothetical protein
MRLCASEHCHRCRGWAGVAALLRSADAVCADFMKNTACASQKRSYNRFKTLTPVPFGETISLGSRRQSFHSHRHGHVVDPADRFSQLS